MKPVLVVACGLFAIALALIWAAMLAPVVGYQAAVERLMDLALGLFAADALFVIAASAVQSYFNFRDGRQQVGSAGPWFAAFGRHLAPSRNTSGDER